MLAAKAALWLAAAVSAFALPQERQLALGSEDLLQLLVSGDVRINLSELVSNFHISVPEGNYFDRNSVNVPTTGVTVGSIRAVLDQAILNCTTCAGNQYTSAACTLTSNTVCSSCSARPSGKYEVSACSHGTASQVGANAVFNVCSEPATEHYVTSTCGIDNTKTQPCDKPTDSQWIVEDCHAGSSNNLGSNTKVDFCRQPQANEWVQTACDTHSNSVVQSCTEPKLGEEYIATACRPGSIKAVGQNAVIQPCSVPPLHSFTKSTCTRDKNTEFASCSPPADGFYTTTVCQAGTPSTVGSNTVTAQCETRSGNNYRSVRCDPGADDRVGKNTVMAFCTTPPQDHFTTAVCGSDDDAKFQKCRQPGLGSFITKDCVQGTFSSLGSDTETQPCKTTQADSFVSSECTTHSDTVFTPCATKTVSQFFKSRCVPGTYDKRGVDANVQNCASPSSGSGYYIKTACTDDSDASIAACTAPESGITYTKTECSVTSDTVLEKCTVPSATQYYTSRCQSGTSTSKGTNAVVQDCSPAPGGSYISKSCSSDANAEFTSCSEPSTTMAQYTTAICTSTSNTVFASCTPLGQNQYFQSRCDPGSSSRVGKDSAPRPCTNPSMGWFTSKVCSENEDTKFSSCAAGQPNSFSAPCIAGSFSTLGTNTQTIPSVSVPATSVGSSGVTKQGTTDASRSFYGDSVYSVTINDEVRELVVNTCGSDVTFQVYLTFTSPITFPTTPCVGNKGVQGFARVPQGTYSIVVQSTTSTAGPYSINIAVGEEVITAQQRFSIFRQAVTYAQAQATCISHGMQLAQPTNQDEANTIGSMVKTTGANSAYIGINDIVEENAFMLSIFNEPVGYTKWARGEPNNAGNIEDCVESYQDGNWNDIPCDALRFFVCSEYRARRTVKTDNQVFVHWPDTQLSYSGAQQICKNNGMRLAHITNNAENNAVKTLITTYNSIWIGVNAIAIPDWWTYSAFNSPVVFTNWQTNQPSSAGYCGQFNPEGKWSAQSCSQTLSFVCSAYLPNKARQSDVQLFVHFDTPANYRTAQSTCAANGLALAHVTSDADVRVLTSLFSSVTRENVWVGAYTFTGTLVSDMTKAAVTNTFFATSTRSRTDYCVDSTVDGKWNDVACTDTRRFVCSGFRDTFTALSNTQKFLVFPKVVGTYQQGLARCKQMGMDLAHVIKSGQPAAASLVQNFNDGNNHWVGLNDLKTKLDWAYQIGGVTAKTLVNWAAGEPNNAGGAEDCAEMRPDGLLNDVGCSANRRALCSTFLFEARATFERRLVFVRGGETCAATGLLFDPIRSADENQAILPMHTVAPGHTNIPGTLSYNVWVDSAGKPLPFTNWASGQPGSADCIRYHLDATWSANQNCSPASWWTNRLCLVPK
eukprot:c52295_g1_i1.p1 GENE.c52295_g1_i1~~c52295_g1_i1.p1  ORF type:complete len:1389 (+),score=203.76 c52295_g1_i1:41-4168(+)